MLEAHKHKASTLGRRRSSFLHFQQSYTSRACKRRFRESTQASPSSEEHLQSPSPARFRDRPPTRLKTSCRARLPLQIAARFQKSSSCHDDFINRDVMTGCTFFRLRSAQPQRQAQGGNWIRTCLLLSLFCQCSCTGS